MSEKRQLGRLVVAALLLCLGLGGAAWWMFSRFVAPRPAAAESAQAPSRPPPSEKAAAPGSSADAVVLSVEGVAERKQGAVWGPLAAGDRLAQSDEVRTGTDGRIELQVGDAASRLTIPDRSAVQMGELTSKLHRLKLDRGRVAFDYRPSGERVLRIEGLEGSAVAETKGARFTALSNGTTVAVAAEEGTVNLSAGGMQVVVGPGQQSVVSGGGAPSAAVAVPLEVLLKVAKVARAAAEAGSCARVQGQVRPGTEVLIDGQVVQVDASGRFEDDVPARGGLRHVSVMAREPGGATRSVRVACRSSEVKQPAKVTIDWEKGRP
jgi:hypothetical protein